MKETIFMIRGFGFLFARFSAAFCLKVCIFVVKFFKICIRNNPPLVPVYAKNM